jgi:hypothetical protein
MNNLKVFSVLKASSLKSAVSLVLILGFCLSAEARWDYGVVADPQTHQPIRIAASKSNSWEGTLMIRLSPEGGVNIVLGTVGTIICAEPCRLRIAFDGVDEGLRDARFPGNIKNMLYLSPQLTPFKKVKGSKRIDVEIQTQEFGWRVMTFDTRDFDLDRLNKTH